MWADELFIWDFVVDTVFEDIIEWFYGQLIGFLSSFFGMMGNMGAEIFDLVWVQGIVHFFCLSCLGVICDRAGGGGI